MAERRAVTETTAVRYILASKRGFASPDRLEHPERWLSAGDLA